MTQRRQWPRPGVNVSAGASLAVSNTVAFSNANGFSFGLSGNPNAYSLTGSFDGGAGGGIKSVSAGTTRITSGEVVLSNANGISFGVSDQTITAAMPTVAVFQAPQAYGDDEPDVDGFEFGIASPFASQLGPSMRIGRYGFSRSLSATMAAVLGWYGQFSFFAVNVAGTYSLGFGAYAITGSTMTLLSSASTSQAWASSDASTVFSYQLRTCPVSFAFTPGDYAIAVMYNGTEASANQNLFYLAGMPDHGGNNEPQGVTQAPAFVPGAFYSTTLSGMLASIPLSAMQRTTVSEPTGLFGLFGWPLIQMVGSGT